MGYFKHLYLNELAWDDGFSEWGEEPYLTFAVTAGLKSSYDVCGHSNAEPYTTAEHWCCGEDVLVSEGKTIEPDNDPRGEEHPEYLQEYLDHGFTVFPPSEVGVGGTFDQIDWPMGGLVVTIGLFERDGELIQVHASDNAAKVKAFVDIQTTLLSLASNLAAPDPISLVESLYDLVEDFVTLFTDPVITIKDPDDPQVAAVWAITSKQAYEETKTTGAYAFYLDTYDFDTMGCGCPGGGYNSNLCPGEWAPLRMGAKLYFVLYREGTPDWTIQDACSHPSRGEAKGVNN